MRQVGAPVVGRLGQSIDKPGKLLNRGVRKAMTDPDRLRLSSASAVSAGLRRQQGVDLVDDLTEASALRRAWPRERDRDLRTDPAGVVAEDQDSVGDLNRLLDIVRDDHDPLCRNTVAVPEIEKVAAKGFRGEHVQ